MGLQTGVHNEITAIAKIKPDKLEQLQAVLTKIGDPNRESPISKISTIHYARWVIIDNDTRLLFTTNFDGDWDNYIDEFINEASEGLDAIWSNCEGFPEGGSKNREAFKQYIREHETKAAVFYSAYPDATVQDVGKALQIRKKFEALLDEFQ